MRNNESTPSLFGLHGNFVGGPVIGCRIVTYRGLYNDQMIVLLDHPCDEGLLAWMTAEEMEVQMRRAKSAEYFPEGAPEDYKYPDCGCVGCVSN